MVAGNHTRRRGADSPLTYCISITGQHGRVKLSPHGGKAFFFEKSTGRFSRPERESYLHQKDFYRLMGIDLESPQGSAVQVNIKFDPPGEEFLLFPKSKARESVATWLYSKKGTKETYLFNTFRKFMARKVY